MANECMYKGIVKGKQNACMALIGSMPCFGEKDWEVLVDGGEENNWEISFEGNCKWSVDSYCEPWTGPFPVEIPEDADEAELFAMEHYVDHTLQDRSKMFGVEVLCVSADVDCFRGETYEHYCNGELIYSFVGCYNTDLISDEWPDGLSICPLETDRVAVYHENEQNHFDFFEFDIASKNSLLEGIVEKYHYKFDIGDENFWRKVFGIHFEEELEDAREELGDNFELAELNKLNDIYGYDPLRFPMGSPIQNYAGVTSVKELTMTLIAAYKLLGKGDDGLFEELNRRVDEISKAFTDIEGYSIEGENNDEWWEGYYFELKDGVFRAKYHYCYGGW